MIKIYANGRLAGTIIEGELIPFVCGADTGAGYVAAAIGQQETSDANQASLDAQNAGTQAAEGYLTSAYNTAQTDLSGVNAENQAAIDAANASLNALYSNQTARITSL